MITELSKNKRYVVHNNDFYNMLFRAKIVILKVEVEKRKKAKGKKMKMMHSFVFYLL